MDPKQQQPNSARPTQGDTTSTSGTTYLQQIKDSRSFAAYLDNNKYPFKLDGRSLYIPGQYIVRKLALSNPSDYNTKGWQQLFTGEEVDISVYKPVEKDCENEFRIVSEKEIKGKIISTCNCCPIQVIQFSEEVSSLLEGNVRISPGDDSRPQSTSLEVVGQNQYAFAFDHDQSGKPKGTSYKSIGSQEVDSHYGAHTPNSEAVKVAIIDTGFQMKNIKGGKIEVGNKKRSKKIPISIGRRIKGTRQSNTCQLNDDYVGWNFVAQSSITKNVKVSENNNPEDDNLGQHGTLIAAIITKKAVQMGANPPEIMVLKAFDSMGVGSMFSILCALCYAEAHDADVINASFVVPSNENISYLDERLKELHTKKIVMVCAAGNRQSINSPKGTDLDAKPLYPALYSEDYDNVLTVTTIWENDKDEATSENYSEKAVNIGVRANCENNIKITDGGVVKTEKSSKWGYFNAPYDLPTGSSWPGAVENGIVGSSFAAPVVAGMVSAIIGVHGGIDDLTKINPNVREVLLTLMPPSTGPIKIVGGDGLVKHNYYVEVEP